MSGERGDDDSISMESIVNVEELASSIKLLNDSPLPASCRIFRVPHKIRRKKVQAYEPDVVSIGPFHGVRHGDSGGKFRLMEDVKHWYLKCFLSRVNITLEGLIKGAMDLYKRARACYAEQFDLNEKDFAEMMVLDGCFLIELFLKVRFPPGENELVKDPVFSFSCMREYLYHDLIMLENQLPWFVLEHLYNLTIVQCTTCERKVTSLTELVLYFFRQSKADEVLLNPGVKIPPRFPILHILDLIRIVLVVSFDDLGSQQTEEHEDQQKSKKTELPQRVRNVTTLSEAGVKFQKSSKKSDCIMNIKFENGVFTVPPLAIDERTGPLFRNLIAFEQCCPYVDHMITSYAVLMDSLIDSSKDINLLSKREILANWLSPEDAAQFFNELYNDTTVMGFYYESLCNDVNKYYKTDWNMWMEKLRREHLGTPWTIISLVAAFILLSLTMLQTVYTIQQYYHPPK